MVQHASDVTKSDESADHGIVMSVAARARQFMQGRRRRAIAGGVGVAIAAFALDTRFSIEGGLGRDESIYAYGAQRFSHGVAPYASIFDPKTPGATILGGLAAAVARLLEVNDLYAIRGAFLALSVLTAVAVYALAVQLFTSIPASVAAGVTFTCFVKFAHDALIGPDAKTPGVLFLVLSMIFMARRRPFLAGVFTGMAFACWQPLFGYAIVAVAATIIYAEPGAKLRRGLRAVAGAALPIIVLGGYFLVAGAFSWFVQSAFVYPLIGTQRVAESLSAHVTHVFAVLDQNALTAILFWVGSTLLLVLVVIEFVKSRRAGWTSPIVLIVLGTFVLNFLYAFRDFQSSPDTLPFLPYPALGIGGAAAASIALCRPGRARRVAGVAVLVGTVVLAAIGWVSFTGHAHDHKLIAQLRSACGVNRIAGPDSLVALGNPTAFVLTHRVSRTNYIYLSAGVDRWQVTHTPGGFASWERHILDRQPPVITTDGWTSRTSRYKKPMLTFLTHHGYRPDYIGRWKVLLDAEGIRRAAQTGVALSSTPRQTAFSTTGAKLPAQGRCASPTPTAPPGPR